MNQSLISISNLYKKFDDNQVLKGINLHVESGDIFGLVGQSGAGKSTLLRCLNGLEKYDQGQVLVQNQAIHTLTDFQLNQLRHSMGMIFQRFQLISRKTIYDNIALPMKLAGMNKKEIKNRVTHLAKLVEIEDKLKEYPRSLSGGQQQRVGIARALSLEPTILLSDEATSALDPAITKSILDLLAHIHQQTGLTMLIVTHQIEVIQRICNKVAIMEQGKIAYQGKTQDMFLEKPEAFKRLIGDHKDKVSINDSDNRLTLLFYNYNKQSSYLSDLAIKTGSSFKIIDSTIEVIAGIPSATITIAFDDQQRDKLLQQIEADQIPWR